MLQNTPLNLEKLKKKHVRLLKIRNSTALKKLQLIKKIYPA